MRTHSWPAKTQMMTNAASHSVKGAVFYYDCILHRETGHWRQVWGRQISVLERLTDTERLPSLTSIVNHQLKSCLCPCCLINHWEICMLIATQQSCDWCETMALHFFSKRFTLVVLIHTATKPDKLPLFIGPSRAITLKEACPLSTFCNEGRVGGG